MVFKKNFFIFFSSPVMVSRRRKRPQSSRFTRKRFKAYARKRHARRLYRRELKSANLDIIASDIDSLAANPEAWQCNSVPEGDGPNEREGRSIVQTRLSIKGSLEWDNNNVTETRVPIRLMVVQDRRVCTTDGAPHVWDVLSSTINFFSHISRDQNRGRYKVLYDKIFIIGSPRADIEDADDTSSRTQLSSNFVGEKLFNIKIKKKLKVHFNTSSGISTALEHNGVYLLAFTKTVMSGAKPHINYHRRVYYVDP